MDDFVKIIKTIKMSERDYRILLAMMSNLQSFLQDAQMKGGDREVDIIISVKEPEVK